MRTPPRSHPKVKVAISTLTAGDIRHGTFSSWNDLVRYDVIGESGQDGCQHVLAGGSIELLSGPRVAEGRSQIVDAFLKREIYKDVDWLLMIDSDMTFQPDALCQLLGHAYDGKRNAKKHKPECYVIGGLCFAGGRTKMYPTIYKGVTRKAWDDTDQVVPEPITDYPRNELVKVMATGAAFLLVHRNVLIHMNMPHPDGFATDVHGQPNPHPWFVEGLSKGVQFGEDVAFCMRANALGYGVYVHTGVQTGHLKTIELNEEIWDEYVARTQKPKRELRLP
jgi:hypothetical protein